ncbi:MAG: glycerophosphodiester phosphodiesterase family protein [Bacillota bacterium]|nr:glycerophosphodiester phosphodiesterase family protein [Bacillota bacterium]
MNEEAIKKMLKEEKAKKNILIATHRGASGGNIIENTACGFDAAIAMGTDIVEADIAQTLDGDLFVIHDTMEDRLFRVNKNIRKMTTKEARELRYINQNCTVMAEGLNTFDEILEHLKGRCLINLDRCWYCWPAVFKTLKKHGMNEQIILKSPPKPDYLNILSACDVPFMYMPILKKTEDLEVVNNAGVNLVALELVFKTEDNPLVDDTFLLEQKKRGLLIWGNAITLDEFTQLAAGHDDDSSILKNPDEGWGYFVKKGFDIIQTDWPSLLHNYLRK